MGSGFAWGMALGLGASVSASGPEASRVEGSPYPAAAVPDTLYTVADEGMPEARRLIVQTLQGSLRGRSALWRIRSGGYALWLDDLRREPGLTVDSSFKNDLPGLLKRLRPSLRGYVLCDLHSPSANAAISLCGVLGGAAGGVVAAASGQDGPLLDLGLPLLADARGRDEAWALAAHPEAFSRSVIVYQDHAKDLFLGDYSVFAGAFQFQAPLESPLAKAALARMRGRSALLGWGDEFDLVEKASRASVHVHAADWAVNISALSRFGKQARQPPPVPPAARTAVHTVCFLMSDGDNLQWALGGFAAAGGWFGHPARGTISMGWTIAPALAELAPHALDRIYRSASRVPGARDHFVAGPSGTGYVFPDLLPDPDSSAALTARFMAKADLRILNLLVKDTAGRYLEAYLRRPGIDAVFLYPFSDYSGLKGAIRFVAGKPVIGGYANLWEGFETPAGLAARLNARPKDPKSAEGYSLIPVHAWSRTLGDIAACIKLLGPGVRVAAPDEFVRAIAENLGPAASVRRPPAGPGARLGRGARAVRADGRAAGRPNSPARPRGR